MVYGSLMKEAAIEAKKSGEKGLSRRAVLKAAEVRLTDKFFISVERT